MGEAQNSRRRKGIDWPGQPEFDAVERGEDSATIAERYGVSVQMVRRKRVQLRWDEKRRKRVAREIITNGAGVDEQHLWAKEGDGQFLVPAPPENADVGAENTVCEMSARTIGDYVPPTGRFDPLARHLAIADRILLLLELVLNALERGSQPVLELLAWAETLKALSEAADRSVRLSRHVRGMRAGEPSQPDAKDDCAGNGFAFKKVVVASQGA